MRTFVAAGLAATVILTTAPTRAFVFAETAAGVPARWRADHVAVVVDTSVDTLGSGARDAVQASFATWRAVRDTSVPEVTFRAGVADPIGYRPNESNANTVRYVPGGYPTAGSALSITIATYDETGAIVDADVVINGLPGLTFAVLDPAAPALDAQSMLMAPYDLQNVVTHEAGHFFGMAHANDLPDDTMFPTSAQGETKKRSLSNDDAAGIRVLYPDALEASCSTRVLGVATSTTWLWAAGLILGCAAIARRRSKLRFTAAPFAAAALVGLVSPHTRAADSRREEPSSAAATVIDAKTWWENGLAFTSIELDVACPNAAACPARRTRIELVGGTLDGLTQVVSGRAVPAIGQRIELPARADGYGWPEQLAPARAALFWE